MTIGGFGQIMPLQGDMLFLAGYGPPNELGSRSLVLQKGDDQIVAAITRGASNLRKFTGKDFGVSLIHWHNFLTNNEPFCAQYMRPSTWESVLLWRKFATQSVLGWKRWQSKRKRVDIRGVGPGN